MIIMSTGRKLDDIWKHFKRLPAKPGGKGCKAKCKHCNHELMGIVARMKSHHSKCRPTEVAQQEHPAGSQEVPGPSTVSQPVAAPKRASSEPSSVSKKKISQYMTFTSKEKKKELDEQVARMIFATNSPFRIVDHTAFKEMVSSLRPGYVPPNRNDISTKFLPDAYEKERQKCKVHLKDRVVCLGLDGWSNIHNEPIVCVTVTTTEGEVYLVETIDTSGHPHTADYLTSLTVDCIKRVEEEFKCTVASIVTDNAANMSKMRRDVAEERKGLITFGCSAHQLNLLAHDLEVAGVKEHVVFVLKYFRNNHFAGSTYRAEGGEGLVLPAETRWNTMADSLNSYIKAWPLLMKICEDHRNRIDPSIRRKVTDLSLKRSAEDLLARLSPVAKGLDKIQADSCTIGRSVDVWKDVQQELEQDRDASAKCSTRYAKAMTPAHFLANILDPSCMGQKLTEKEGQEALQFASDHYNDDSIMATIMKYQGKSQPFNAFQFSKDVTSSMTPMAWWKSHCRVIPDVFLQAVAQLMSASASSASVERVFSSFGLVHSKMRNRLGTENAAMLTFLFKELNK